jgi:hypothetical protein
MMTALGLILVISPLLRGLASLDLQTHQFDLAQAK